MRTMGNPSDGKVGICVKNTDKGLCLCTTDGRIIAGVRGFAIDAPNDAMSEVYISAILFTPDDRA